MAIQALKHQLWSESPDALPAGRTPTRTQARRWVVLAVAGWVATGAAALVAAAEWQRADQLARLAGFTPLTGRGVEITISDSRQPQAPGAKLSGYTAKAAVRGAQAPPPAQAIMTDGDLILLNMLLWYGGAHAVAINGQRITAQTTITSSGPVILINGTRVVSPFLISALGDPTTLRGVLTEAGTLEQLQSAGINVHVATQSALRIPAWQPGEDAVH